MKKKIIGYLTANGGPVRPIINARTGKPLVGGELIAGKTYQVCVNHDFGKNDQLKKCKFCRIAIKQIGSFRSIKSNFIKP